MPSAILNTLTHLTSTAGRPISAHLSKLPRTTPTTAQTSSSHKPRSFRPFSSTSSTQSWLLPRKNEAKKSRKGRPRVPTGGSARGTTLIHGTYGIRLLDHHRRISAAQLKNGETVIRQRLKGMKYRLYTRICANIGVYTSGNEVRMGKGKGRFDYWAARVAVSKVIFEIEGGVHEKVAREAVRLAGNKLPGLYEFVKKGDPPVVGITKLTDGVTLETLKRPRRDVPLPMKAEETQSAVDGVSGDFAGLALGSSAVASGA